MAAELKLTVTAVEGSANAAKNTSQVKIKLQITTSYGTYNLTGSTAGKITLDGEQIASLAGKKVNKDTTTTLYSAVHTVQHKADGTRTVQVKASFDVETSVRWIYAEQQLTLPPILRSTLEAEELPIGGEAALHIRSAAPELEHEVRYTFGDKTGVAIPRTAETELIWAVPLELAEEIPESGSGEGTLTLVSCGAEGEAGSCDYAVTLTLPWSHQPTLRLESVTVENDNAVLDGWGIAVKGRSRIVYEATAEPSPGAYLTKTEFRFGQRRINALSGSFTAAQAGRLTPTVTVVDSRGRNAGSGLAPITVYDYSLPRLREVQAIRCNAEGVADEGGSYALVRCSASHAALDGRNRLTLQCRWRQVGGAWSADTALEDGVATILAGFDPAHSYEVEFSAADTVGGQTVESRIVPTEAVSFALADGGAGAGFGKYPERAGLDMGWDIHMNGNAITGLPAPTADSDAVPWGRVNFDLVYPVGSLYLTVSAADPAELFGGTWQQLRDVFLLAAGGSYELGQTGGEAEHVLTAAEMPSHRHTTHGVPTQLYSGGYAAMRSAEMSQQSSTTGCTNYTGGGGAHNNMPPYLAVNVWQRTA